MDRTPLLACLLLLASCASGTGAAPSGGSLSSIPAGAHAAYTLAPGDEVEVVFHTAPELDRIAAIGPDGKIRLPLVPPVSAANVTPEILAQRLEAVYATQLLQPDLDVLPLTYEGQRIFVGGAVETPGALILDGPLDPFQALIMAGGPTREANMGQVLVLRRSAGDTIETFEVDLSGGSAAPGLQAPIALQRFDIVYVPRTAIANQNRVVSQYIRNALPLDFFLIYDVADGSD